MKIINEGKFWTIEYEGEMWERRDLGRNYSTVWEHKKSGVVYPHYEDKFRELENEFIKLVKPPQEGR